MENTNNHPPFQSLKVYREQVHEIVAGRMRTAVMDMVFQLFEDELNPLCGPRYCRGEYYRAGSDPGSIYVNGQRVSIKKPRVKKGGKDVEVQTYSALRNYDLLSQRIEVDFPKKRDTFLSKNLCNMPKSLCHAPFSNFFQ